MRFARILVPVAMVGLVPLSVSAQQAPSPLDRPIETIADSSGGCAVLDKDFPGLRDHPMYPFFKAMTLNQIAAMSKGQITPDMLAQASTDLTALDTATATTASVDLAEDPSPTPLVAMTVAAPPAPAPATVAAMH